MVQGVNKVSDIVGEIAAASKEQSSGIDQVNQAITSIDKVTRSNSAGSEETASASEELAAQATEVQNLIGQFKLSSGRKQETKVSDESFESGRVKQYQNVKRQPSLKQSQDASEVISLDDVDFGEF